MPKRARGGALTPIVPVAPAVTSRKHARRLTSQYHVLTQKISAATTDGERDEARAELDRMGGVKAYQQASALNTALNPTSRWAARAIRAAAGQSPPRQPPIRVLEIGAVNTQLLDTPGLAVRAIDLHALDPRIEQRDFLSLTRGGEMDAASGVTQLYDAVVCSMVLNCVPDERKRFEMLVGMRAQLRAGGRAFVTLPRSCLDHSYTLTEESFADALAAVGLLPLAAGRGALGKPPQSAKIIYFETVAGLPDAEAAVRFQRARFEKRAAQRAAQRGGADASARGALPRPKSAGAFFDVDLGGYLGFGVRVARSYAPPHASRAEREQALCRAAFLGRHAPEQQQQPDGQQQQQQEEEEPPRVEAVGDDERGAEELQAGAMRRAIEQQLARHPSQLDYARWRWYSEGGARDAAGGVASGWHLVQPGAGPPPPGSAQEQTGWQWGASGWAQKQPTAPAMAPGSAADGDGRPAARLITSPRRRARSTARRRTLETSRVGGFRRPFYGCWWRRLLSCRALGC